eukprot:3089182-Amphidinium_carterae.1
MQFDAGPEFVRLLVYFLASSCTSVRMGVSSAGTKNSMGVTCQTKNTNVGTESSEMGDNLTSVDLGAGQSVLILA